MGHARPQLSDASSFRRTLGGAALITGPMLALIAALIVPTTADGPVRQTLAEIAADRGAWEAAAILSMASAVLIVPAAFALLHLLRERAVALGHIGATLLLIGAFGLFAMSTYDFVLAEMVVPEADAGQMVPLAERVEGSSGFLVVLISLTAGMTLGVILLGVALWRAATVPAWVGAVLVGSQIVIAAGHGTASRLVVGAGFALLTIGFLPVALRVLGMSDAQWRHGTHSTASEPRPATSHPQTVRTG